MTYTAQQTLTFEDFLPQYGDSPCDKLADGALNLTVEQILEA